MADISFIVCAFSLLLGCAFLGIDHRNTVPGRLINMCGGILIGLGLIQVVFLMISHGYSQQ
jgi:hypothetical protein